MLEVLIYSRYGTLNVTVSLTKPSSTHYFFWCFVNFEVLLSVHSDRHRTFPIFGVILPFPSYKSLRGAPERALLGFMRPNYSFTTSPPCVDCLNGAPERARSTIKTLFQ